jgi:Cytadhesin P30/P32.
MTSGNKTIVKEKWYESPVKKGFAILSGFVFVSSIGYGLAIVQKNLEFRMEKYEMQQAFNEKLQMQISDCQKEKQLLENKRVEAMESAIMEIQKKFNEK